MCTGDDACVSAVLTHATCLRAGSALGCAPSSEECLLHNGARFVRAHTCLRLVSLGREVVTSKSCMSLREMRRSQPMELLPTHAWRVIVFPWWDCARQLKSQQRAVVTHACAIVRTHFQRVCEHVHQRFSCAHSTTPVNVTYPSGRPEMFSRCAAPRDITVGAPLPVSKHALSFSDGSPGEGETSHHSSV